MIILDLIKRIGSTYLEQTYLKPFANKNHERKITSDNSIVLLCHPRGGSTWLGEILKTIQGSILIDEPLWRGFYRSANYSPKNGEGKIKSLSKLGFYFDQPIPLDTDWKEANKIIGSIIKGTFWNYQLYDENEFTNFKNAQTHIIKFCYGHLLFPWLQHNFDITSIVLHRHPCAVVASQINHAGFTKIIKNPSGTIPDFRFNEIYQKYGNVWKTIDSKEEYLAAIWALKTKYICENSDSKNNLLTIFYEELVNDFNSQIEKINKHVNFNLSNKAFALKSKPSSSITHRNHLRSGINQLDKWKTTLKYHQINKILKIVEKFEIELYDESLMPYNKFIT